ncbi:MAG: hypothetical protein OWR62_04175 [Sulfobacillus thermotolerans]|nr:hypothetical protein [Sulfobacillus thermotolerans]
MTVVYWRLAHLKRSGQDQDGFIVERENKVYDTDPFGWNNGVRQGMSIQEMKWRYPYAKIIPWSKKDYQSTYDNLCQWLNDNALFYVQDDVQQGYWGCQEMNSNQWQHLVTSTLLQWATRSTMGIASHSLLAQWLAHEGAHYPQLTEHWTQAHHEAYVARENKEEELWKLLPLEYLPENIPEYYPKDWKKRGWLRVGDVPNLYTKVKTREFGGQHFKSTAVIRVEKRFDSPVEQGIPELVRIMAEEIARILRERRQGSRQLRIIWEHEQGDEMRKRTWPVQTENPQQVVTRFLTLLSVLPQAPPQGIILEAHQIEDLRAEQMAWWSGPVVRRFQGDPEGPISESRRTRMLQYWDPWRRGHSLDR